MSTEDGEPETTAHAVSRKPVRSVEAWRSCGVTDARLNPMFGKVWALMGPPGAKELYYHVCTGREA